MADEAEFNTSTSRAVPTSRTARKADHKGFVLRQSKRHCDNKEKALKAAYDELNAADKGKVPPVYEGQVHVVEEKQRPADEETESSVGDVEHVRLPSPPRPTARKETTKLRRVDRYVGVRSPSEARQQITKKCYYVLYHEFDGSLLEKGSLPVTLPLMVAYQTCLGEFCRFPVRSHSTVTEADGCSRHFYVDCGSTRPLLFFSLDNLVDYYDSHALVYSPKHSTTQLWDRFEWWTNKERDVSV